MLRLEFDMSGLTKDLDKLRDTVEQGIVPAVAAGAKVYYDEMKQRASAIGPVLGESIYRRWNKDIQVPGRAQYRISWRKGSGKASIKTAGDGETGLPIAAHGQLIEYGYVQRYASYIGSDGNWYTAIRKDAKGKAPPKRRASQAAKDAYYVLRQGGPIMHAPRSFLRATYYAREQDALRMVETKMQEQIKAAA